MKVFFAVLVAAAAVALAYETPRPSGDGVLFFEPFDTTGLSRWTLSTAGNNKYAPSDALELRDATYAGGKGDKQLVLREPARFYGLSAPLAQPWDPAQGRALVVQYEVRLGKEHECGGVYLKLLSANASHADPLAMTDATPFTVMFGPDHCGGATNKVHFIARHPSPKTGVFEEKHLTDAPAMKLDVAVSHLYTLTLEPDGTFDVAVDGKIERTGNLLKDFEPPVNPPKEIPDPADVKPEDWVDDEEIPDPEAAKPEDWDEDAPETIPDPEASKPEDWDENAPEMVPDAKATKPADWDDDMDGEWVAPEVPNPFCEEHGCGKWEAPMIPNPEYRGKWEPPMIPNPEYKGPFVPRMIPNPNYFYDEAPFKALAPIARVAIEVWTVTPLVGLDNILVATDPAIAKQVADQAWAGKFKLEEEEHRKELEAEQEPKENKFGALSSYISVINDYIDLMSEFAQKNQPAAIGIFTAVFGVVPILLWLSCRSSPKKPKEKKEEEKPAAAAADAAAAAAAPEEEKEKKAERSVTPRKGKAPRDDQ